MRCLVLLAAFFLLGCALTDDERRTVIDESARVAAELAHKKAIDAGLSEADAKKVADAAREDATAIAARAIPKAEESKRGKFGAAVASILLALVQLASAGLKRGLPPVASQVSP